MKSYDRLKCRQNQHSNKKFNTRPFRSLRITVYWDFTVYIYILSSKTEDNLDRKAEQSKCNRAREEEEKEEVYWG